MAFDVSLCELLKQRDANSGLQVDDLGGLLLTGEMSVEPLGGADQVGFAHDVVPVGPREEWDRFSARDCRVEHIKSMRRTRCVCNVLAASVCRARTTRRACSMNTYGPSRTGSNPGGGPSSLRDAK